MLKGSIQAQQAAIPVLRLLRNHTSNWLISFGRQVIVKQPTFSGKTGKL